VKTAIMQPYFLPYIGYWQLINSADQFVVYDNIKFTKKGWFNRNRILETNHDRLFTIPIKKASDYLPVNKRYLSDDSDKEILRTLRIIEANYKKAPHFLEAYPVIKGCFLFPDRNLFEYIFNSIKIICEYLTIKTKIITSSTIDIDHSHKGEKKVIAICKNLSTTIYINSAGGTELYGRDEFSDSGLDLKFLKPKNIEYKQFGPNFVSWLSIIDVMMFNDKNTIKRMLDEYELV
jgi:hypothetical protein